MKKILALLTLIGISQGANALTMSDNACYANSGQIYVRVQATAWDKVYYGHVVFYVRNGAMQWASVAKPLAYGTNTYALSVFQETQLDDVSQYNIGTDRGVIIVAPCDDGFMSHK